MYVYIVKWLPKSGELTHASPHKFIFFVCVVRILKIYSLGKFQVYSTPLLTTATMRCIDQHLHTSPPSSTSQPPFYSLFLSSTYFRFYRQMRPYSIFLSLLGSFHLAWCPLGSHILSQMAGVLSFLWLNNIPLQICYIFFIHFIF